MNFVVDECPSCGGFDLSPIEPEQTLCNDCGQLFYLTVCDFCAGTGKIVFPDVDDDDNIIEDEEGKKLLTSVNCPECKGTGAALGKV